MDDEADVLVQRARARVGQIIRDKWKLERLLGVGGMAAVYAASHRNGKSVAVKWLHHELTIDKHARARFLREGYIANKVNHPGAVSVLDDDTADDGALVLVMELLEGETIDARCRRAGGRLPATDVLLVMHQVLDVLAAAHANGIVHRDLKPENLFLTKGGVVKVLDFGIARLRELSGKSGATQSHSSLGTPAFMPPEQARGRWQEVDARSDLWAIGATMFELVAGRHVHEAPTVNEQLLAAMTEKAPPLESFVSDAPAPFARVVDRALSFEKDDRWANAREMQLAVREAYREIVGQPLASAAPLVAADATDDDLGPVSETLPVVSAGPASRTTERGAAVAGDRTTHASARQKRARAAWAAAAIAVLLGAPALFFAARSNGPAGAGRAADRPPDRAAAIGSASASSSSSAVEPASPQASEIATAAGAPAPSSAALPPPSAIATTHVHVSSAPPPPTTTTTATSAAPATTAAPPATPPPPAAAPPATGDPLDRRR